MREDAPPAVPASAVQENLVREPRHAEMPRQGQAQLQPAFAPSALSRVVRELAPAIVHLTVAGGRGEHATAAASSDDPAGGQGGLLPDGALGTGVIIDREGYIVTSQPVVAGAAANSIRVRLLGSGEFPAELVGQDTELGVALLKFEPPVVPAVLELGSSDELAVGDWVMALGNPSGDEVTASTGILSSVGGRGDGGTQPSSRSRVRLHTDAAIHRGNRGGPLVDIQGRMIGLSLGSNASAGLGVALPTRRLNDALPMLKRGGGAAVARTWLGIRILPDEGGRGAIVSEVIAGGPGDKAGIRRGDIIVTFAGQAIDHQTLPELSAGTAPGKRVPIGLLRNGASVTTELTSEAKP